MSGRSTVTMTVRREESNLSSMHPLLGGNITVFCRHSIHCISRNIARQPRIIVAVSYVSRL
ncbi:hypothetical protein K439DRAFT_1632046 [Ramaria rubella]|nr:hypothetical protein K439DRAFT_1632046 [Ramaria rubella]